MTYIIIWYLYFCCRFYFPLTLNNSIHYSSLENDYTFLCTWSQAKSSIHIMCVPKVKYQAKPFALLWHRHCWYGWQQYTTQRKSRVLCLKCNSSFFLSLDLQFSKLLPFESGSFTCVRVCVFFLFLRFTVIWLLILWDSSRLFFSIFHRMQIWEIEIDDTVCSCCLKRNGNKWKKAKQKNTQCDKRTTGGIND